MKLPLPMRTSPTWTTGLYLKTFQISSLEDYEVDFFFLVLLPVKAPESVENRGNLLELCRCHRRITPSWTWGNG